MKKNDTSKKTAKQMHIPVKETVLASEDGFNGVLIQKTLPPLWIYTKKGEHIKIPAIPLDELNRANGKSYLAEKKFELDRVKGKKQPQIEKMDYIWNVFEKYLRQVPNCPKDISFLRQSLNTFYAEFMYMDLNHLYISNMLRAALKRGVRFIFFEEGAVGDTGMTILKTARAQYNEGDNALEFNCKLYNDLDAEQNTLAHELSHYIIGCNRSDYYGLLVESDIGMMLAECLKMEAFFGYPEWKKAIKTYKKIKSSKAHQKNKKQSFNLFGVDEFFFSLAVEHKEVLHFFDVYKDLEERREEMFARLMGILAQRDGLKMLGRDDPKRFGVQLICDLAGAKANGNNKLYDNMIQVLKDYVVSSELKSKIIDFNAVKQDIVETRKFSLNNRVHLQKRYYDLCCDMKEECKKIRKEIQNRYKNGLSEEQIILNRQTAQHASKIYDKLVASTMFRVKKDEKVHTRIDILNMKIEQVKQVKKQRKENKKLLKNSGQPLEYPVVVYNKNQNVFQNLIDKQRQ